MLTVMRGAEVRLVEALNELSDRPEGWSVVVFHLAELLDEYKSEYQIRIAVNLVNDLLKTSEGGVYVCNDSTIAVLARDLPQQLRKKLVFQLRYLYMDDPLAYSSDGSENEAFSTSYDLESDFAECLQYFTRRMTSLSRNARAAAIPLASTSRAAKAAHTSHLQENIVNAPLPIPLFSATRLVSLEQDLAHADIALAVRRQPVCAMSGATAAKRVFDEFYIHMTHLRELLKTDVDFLSNKWLFKYLTRLIDARVLALIVSDPKRYVSLPLSLNINVETVLSNDFTVFDASLSPADKVSIVFEIPAIDVFADTAAFTVAVKQLQKSGYRVCLDGLTDMGFLQIQRERLGVDLVKMQWNSDFATDVKKRENKPLREAVRECGANRVILCRCDTKEAVEYGQAMGISLFQGRYLDHLFDPTAKVRN